MDNGDGWKPLVKAEYGLCVVLSSTPVAAVQFFLGGGRTLHNTVVLCLLENKCFFYHGGVGHADRVEELGDVRGYSRRGSINFSKFWLDGDSLSNGVLLDF